MIPIIIKGTTYNLPQTWQEVTMQQYAKMCRHKDDLNACRLLSIFTAIDYDVLQAYSMDVFESNILSLMNQFSDAIQFSSIPVKEVLNINGRNVNVPKDLRSETFGQKILMQAKLNKLIDDNCEPVEMFAHIAATYLQPGYHGELFNDKKVNEVEVHINALPVTDIYPIANFFLTSYIQSSKMS